MALPPGVGEGLAQIFLFRSAPAGGISFLVLACVTWRDYRWLPEERGFNPAAPVGQV